MVKIDKSGEPTPLILQPGGRGAIENEDFKRQYDTGVRTFTFDSNIYGDVTVKQALIRIQHGKCCFCESKIRHVSSGDTEHFRPKAGYQQDPTTLLHQPGYYWLAYDFSNLFLSCEICNRIFKKNFFPLADETWRVFPHHHGDIIEVEDPLIIHPEFDDPAEHIYFEREVPHGLNKKGELTIQRTGLDRKDLNDERLHLYEYLAYIAANARGGDTMAIEIIKKSVLSNARYSLMVRCNFPDLL